MAGLIKFKVNKYVHGDRYKSIYGFKPKAVIRFERVTIGQIVDNEVYFYIKVKPGQSNNICLNYIPVLWRTFSNHQEARDAVIKQANEIWESLDIFHPLKKVKSTYGLWEKK